uniref:exodeoxyribonuclease V subunit gamma n=1 Tax=Ningiella ruwaisensis TaxID=2364274 RepID=UPI00109F6547|nr:exodeoxyribonuclease V subunit gamma [Ningiella ruwaisensis]
MLYLYPSNRIEHLVSLLDAVLANKPVSVFSPRMLLVQHTGMQHYLSLSLAQKRGIAMQFDFPLPTRFIWETCRSILANQAVVEGSSVENATTRVPQQSPYKREVMVWRILSILHSDDFKQSPYFDAINQFFTHEDDANQATQRQSEQILKSQKQFRFAMQLADLFEQYLVFRSDWIVAWDKHEDFSLDNKDTFSAVCYEWQKWFWHTLTSSVPEHPVSLQLEAMRLLEAPIQSDMLDGVLPKDIYLFAINSLPPIYLRFFDVIAKHINVHWFHLNPSIDYWADAKSDKAIAAQMRRNKAQNWADEIHVHPLLRNFGQQGRDLLKLLLDCQHHEFSAFESPAENDTQARHLLQTLQQDILNFAPDQSQALDEDKASSLNSRQFNAPSNIHVHACHHQVRELQVLKDFLFAQLNEDAELQLSDIIVMCPAIEQYSPYIKGIFESQDALSLATSISDRKPIESQSTINAFMMLLNLPSSRFSADQLLQLLETPSLMQAFDLSATDTQFCRAWVEQACISFGLDATQKAQTMGVDKSVAHETLANETLYKHTWDWGLTRLLNGTLQPRETLIANQLAIAHCVEGQAQQTLGKLIRFIAHLQKLSHSLQIDRSISDWHAYLNQLLEKSFFQNEESEFDFVLLSRAFKAISENALLADFDNKISLSELKLALQQGLSIPETKSGFMAGKITFCSMMPLRTIPFKIVAILGLNQNSFPRHAYPSELDLMAKASGRVGDRSRRNDDRYLFLEALISARKHLYLSYQHRNVQTNAKQSPSLVLQELVSHCHKHYGEQSIRIIEHPLHAFSLKAFSGDEHWQGSFESGWARHAKSLYRQTSDERENKPEQLEELNHKPETVDTESRQSDTNYIDAEELVHFFKAPMQYFANKTLNLHFSELDENEFEQAFDFSPLSEYKMRSHFAQILQSRLQSTLSTNASDAETEDNWAKQSLALEQWSRYLQLSGELPDFADIENNIEQHRQEIEELIREAFENRRLSVFQNEFDVAIPLASVQQRYTLKVQCQVDNESNFVHLIYKQSLKTKDKITAWVKYIVYCNSLISSQAEFASKSDHSLLPAASIMFAKAYRGKIKVFNEPLPRLNPAQAKTLLYYLIQWFLKGKRKALFVNPLLIDEMLKIFKNAHTKNETSDENTSGFIANHQNTDALLASKTFQGVWQKQAENAGKHTPYDALCKDPYFDYLFGKVMKLERHLLSIYEQVYLPMFDLGIPALATEQLDALFPDIQQGVSHNA